MFIYFFFFWLRSKLFSIAWCALVFVFGLVSRAHSFASSFVFVVTLNHVREGCSFDCGCWLILIGDLGLSMLVWSSRVVMWSLFHRDYSLTLDCGVIVGDSVWSFWIGLIGSQGIGCDLWSRWVGGLLIELSWIVIGDSWFEFRSGVVTWLSCDCIVMSWLIVSRGLGMGWLGVICF